MFTTPQKRGATTTFNSPSTRVQANTKGLFSDGIWHCNCSPRLPATHFQVKKEGRNKNRWFYTCQTNKEDGGCGFFLWQEEAQTREGKTVMNNSRSEQEPSKDTTKQKGASDRDERRDKGRLPLVGRVNEDDNSSHTARKESSAGSSDDFGEWLSPSDERKMITASEVRYSSPPWPESSEGEPTTPSRKSMRTPEFTTPGSKRKRNAIDADDVNGITKGLPTPVTGGGRVRNASEYGFNDSDPFSTPSSLRTASVSLFGMRSPSHTPQPSHMRQPDYPDLPQPSHVDAGRNQAATTTVASQNNYDITPDVLALLQEEGIGLGANAEHKLRNLLSKHAMRVSGIAKGRDITRVALKSKDIRIADLGLRIGQLEAEREVDRRVLRSLRADRGDR